MSIDTVEEITSELNKLGIEEKNNIEENSINLPVFTDNEKKIYEKQKDKSKYKTPEEEYREYSSKEKKTCSNCYKTLFIYEFMTNTSGRDAFNRDGLRLRRPECKCCTKEVSKGKSVKKIAKKNKVSYKAPSGEKCGICGKETKLVFDHCHKKNIHRGYLCDPCNRSLGVLGDTAEELIKSLNYLLKNEPLNIEQDKETKLLKIIK